MADPHHLKKLGEGVNAWNRWREQHPETLPDLRKVDVHEKVLTGIDFRHTHLDGAHLCNAKLCSALCGSQ